MITGEPSPTSPALDLNGPADLPFQAFEPTWVGQSAFELFRKRARRHPDRIACGDGAVHLTYGEVLAGAEGLADQLLKEVGDHAVGVLLANDARYPVAVLGCLAAARPCVMLDRYHPAARVAAIIKDAGISTVILKRADLESGLLLPAGVRIVIIDEAAARGSSTPFQPVAASSDVASFVVYTSGSTGRPKGIVLSQRSVLHRAAELINAVHLNKDDKVLSLASPSTIGGLQQIFEVMLGGATLFKLDLQRLSLEKVLDVVQSYGVTMMFSTPAVWRAIARIDGARRSLASLRCIQTSGEVLLRVDLDAVRKVLPPSCHVLSVYGATEAPALLQWFVPSNPPADETRVPAGYPLPAIDISIVGDGGSSVPDGEAGELVITSAWTALGLWRNGAVGPGSFEIQAANASLRTYRTGDFARRRSDGLFVILGRKDRQIKIRGNRIELADIESALKSVAFVADAAVLARTVDGEPFLVAFVVPRQPPKPGVVAAIRAALRESLPGYMRPSHLIVLDEIPLLPGRKVDEDALLAIAKAQMPGADRGRPENDAAPASPRASEIVSQSWRRTLGRRPPVGDETFDEVSGDSLRLLQLVFHMERLSGLRLPLDRFPGALRPSEFARELDLQMSASAVLEERDRPPVFFVPGYGGDEPRLGHLRAACVDTLNIIPLLYPEVDVLAARGASFGDITAFMVEQIEGAGLPGPITLAGYSIGGDVAYEVACRLQEKGRQVSLLCIFDTDAGGSMPPPPSRTVAPSNKFDRLRQIVHRGDWHELVSALLPPDRVVLPHVLAMVRALTRARRLLPANLIFYVSRHFQAALILAHHAAWTKDAKPRHLVRGRTVLFRSQQYRDNVSTDLGWAERTEHLELVAVAGDHYSMFAQPNVSAISRQFTRTVCEAPEV